MGCVEEFLAAAVGERGRMNVIQEISRINEEELKRGIIGGSSGSWHQQYRDSSYVYAGGLPFDLTEGDVLCVFSQWGEIEDINLVRDEATGKSKGFAFVKYEDQRSTVLAVDNFNGMKLLGRMIRVDHVSHYKLPKHLKDKEEEAAKEAAEAGYYGPSDDGENGDDLYKPGHAYKDKELANEFDISKGVDLYAAPKSSDDDEDGSSSDDDADADREKKRAKKEKKALKKIKKKAKKMLKKEKKKAKKGEAAADPEPPAPALGMEWGMDAPPPPADDEDDSWRGRMARGRAGGFGGGRGALGMNKGGFGHGGKGAKLMGPKFGGGGGQQQRDGKGKGGGGKGGNGRQPAESFAERDARFDRSYGGMSRLR